jgi:hypothetical protein
MKQEQVEQIAVEYVERIGVRPCLLEGSEFDDKDDLANWRVYFSFCESSEKAIGLPHSLVIEVDDVTGVASHIEHL